MNRRWPIGMRWERLLFAHWPVSAAALRAQLPDGLELDLFDGEAWLGIVPFWMARVGPAGWPLPGRLGNFGELNVRTYVRPTNERDGPPGVWFLSLDAENPYLVAGGRAVFHVPYRRARISVREVDGLIDYRLRRTHAGASPARFEAQYRPIGPAVPAMPNSLDDWLTARYSVYAADSVGQVYRGDVRHAPWLLAPAEWELRAESLLAEFDLERPGTPPLLHFAEDRDVVAALPVRIGR